jgi:hypothetical protein
LAAVPSPVVQHSLLPEALSSALSVERPSGAVPGPVQSFSDLVSFPTSYGWASFASALSVLVSLVSPAQVSSFVLMEEVYQSPSFALKGSNLAEFGGSSLLV